MHDKQINKLNMHLTVDKVKNKVLLEKRPAINTYTDGKKKAWPAQCENMVGLYFVRHLDWSDVITI